MPLPLVPSVALLCALLPWLPSLLSVGAVQQVRDDGAVQFDFNHPLAGQAVVFEVQVIGVL